MPDKSAMRVVRLEGGPQGERSESSRENNKLDPGLRRGDDLFRVSLSRLVSGFFQVAIAHLACGMTVMPR